MQAETASGLAKAEGGSEICTGTKMSRYARLTLDIRFLRHHQGAYLLWNHRRLPMCRTNVVLQILLSA